MTDGEKIRLARQAAGLSIRELARRMGVHRRVVMYWETDQVRPMQQDAKLIWLLLSVRVQPREPGEQR